MAGRYPERERHPTQRLNYKKAGNPNYEVEAPVSTRRPSSRTSHSSKASKTLSVKEKELDAELSNSLLELEQTLASEKKDVRVLQGRLHTARQKLDALKKSGKSTDEENEVITSLEMQILETEEKLNEAIAEVEYSQATLQARKEALLARHALEKEKLDDLDDEVESEFMRDPKHVTDWLESLEEEKSEEKGEAKTKQFPDESVGDTVEDSNLDDPNGVSQVTVVEKKEVRKENGDITSNKTFTVTPSPPLSKEYDQNLSLELQKVNLQTSQPQTKASTRRHSRLASSPPLHNSTGFQGAKLQPRGPSSRDRFNPRKALNYPPTRFQSYHPPPPWQVPLHLSQPPGYLPPHMQQHYLAPTPAPASPVQSEDGMMKLAKVLKSVLGRDTTAKLPTFAGEPEKWSIFNAAFKETHDDFTARENLTRLNQALSGVALEAVQHLLHNKDNVKPVMETLEKSFGRPKLVLDRLIKLAKDSRPVDQADPESMIKFGRIVESLVENIHAFEKLNYLNDHYVVEELVQKLPQSMQNRWSVDRAKDSRDPTLQVFLAFIKPHVEGALYRFKPGSDDKRRFRRQGVHSASQEDATDEQPLPCAYCEKENHKVDKCFRFSKLSLEKRWEVAKEKKWCYQCLSSVHKFGKEHCPGTACKIDKCGKPHHALLHKVRKEEKASKSAQVSKEDSSSEDDEKVSEEEESSEESKAEGQFNAATNCSSLPVVRVKINGTKGCKNVFAVLDSAASFSMIESDLAEEIGLDGEMKELKFSVYGDKRSELSKLVSFKIKGIQSNAKEFDVNAVYTVDKLGINVGSLDMHELKRKYPNLGKVKAISYNNLKPQILLGYNYYFLFHSEKVIWPEHPEDPYAFKTPLGWHVLQKGNEDSCHITQEMSLEAKLHEEMKAFFSTENFGVVPAANSQRSKEDKRALELLEKNTVLKDGRWESVLLWKNDDPCLPNNKIMALRRLYAMEKKMDADPEFAKLVTDKFADYIQKGYFVKKSQANIDESNCKRKWYLPWFFAYHPTKKPRLVLDGAAKYMGFSLNDFLLTGPDLLNPLPDVLTRFRKHPIGLTGDLKEMFHHVTLHIVEWPSQTVLFRGMDRDGEPEEYYMTRLFFGAGSSPCIALFVVIKNAKRFLKMYPEAVFAILFEIYMDDLLSGGASVEKVIELRRQIDEIFTAGGFVMTKWNSSSKEVLESIPTEHRAEGAANFVEKGDIILDKTLGLWWSASLDSFTFKINLHRVKPEVLRGDRAPTKRDLASIVMSLFDPLGFAAPLKVKALIMIQDVWRSGIDWDDEIPSDIQADWEKWMAELPMIENIRIPRRLEVVDGKSQLHCFCDASEKAYSCVTYLVTRLGGSQGTKVQLVAGKARVAPLRGLTIPRMELQAAVMGTRLTTHFKPVLASEVSDLETFYWSDSKCVLTQIRSETLRYKVFQQNRINEIVDSTNVKDWRWVPTKLNVADDATRLSSITDLSSSSRWLSGPEFLSSPEKWPVEDKRSSVNFEDMGVHLSSTVEDAKRFTPKADDYSTWSRLIRHTAYIRVFCRFLLKRKPMTITVADLKWAQEQQIKASQEDSFPEELIALRGGNPVSKHSKICKLSPILVDGVIVLKGRIDNAPGLHHAVKNPPILAEKSPYVKLLIDELHKCGAHQGQGRVRNELRQKVWVPNARVAVRRCWSECGDCAEKRAMPTTPMIGQLPAARLGESHFPFNNTGVDYFGPILCSQMRKTVKRWGVLFTCLSTRAVHLDLADSLDTSDMINTLVRFIAVRGRPSEMFSDNGTNLKGGNREMKEALKELEKSDLISMMTAKGIDWKFAPPTGSHFGGVYERMIGLVKKCLSHVLKDKHPKEGILRTLFAEVMEILNNRPLTYVSPNPDDPESLTPNHILRLRCVPSQTVPGIYTEKDQYRKAWRNAQYLADQFWKRFTMEYLPTLARKEKWIGKAEPLKVGDIVLVLNDLVPRSEWKKGMIVATFPAKDGQVRVVKVRVPTVKPEDKDKKVKFRFYRRPAVKVIPLGISSVAASSWEGECLSDEDEDEK